MHSPLWDEYGEIISQWKPSEEWKLPKCHVYSMEKNAKDNIGDLD